MLRFQRILLLALAIGMPFLVRGADSIWNLSRAIKLGYEPRCFLILLIVVLAVVLCIKVASCNPPKPQDPAVVVVPWPPSQETPGFPLDRRQQPPLSQMRPNSNAAAGRIQQRIR